MENELGRAIRGERRIMHSYGACAAAIIGMGVAGGVSCVDYMTCPKNEFGCLELEKSYTFAVYNAVRNQPERWELESLIFAPPFLAGFSPVFGIKALRAYFRQRRIIRTLDIADRMITEEKERI